MMILYFEDVNYNIEMGHLNFIAHVMCVHATFAPKNTVLPVATDN